MKNCPEDRVLALQGYDALYYIDRYAFPDGPRAEIRWMRRIGNKPDLMFKLGLNEETGGIFRECYYLRAHNLTCCLDTHLAGMRSEWEPEHRTLLLVSLALHEVRHRLQYHRRVTLFTRENVPAQYQASAIMLSDQMPEITKKLNALNINSNVDFEFDAIMSQAFAFEYLKRFIGMDFDSVLLPRVCEMLFQHPDSITSIFETK